MRATWLGLWCWAVLAFSPLTVLAAQAPEPAGKEETKLLDGKPLTRNEFTQLQAWTEHRRQMRAYDSTATPEKPVPLGTEVPWEVLPTYWPVPPPGAASVPEVLAALKETRTFQLSRFVEELRVEGGLPPPLVQRNFEVQLQVKELRDAKGRKVSFQPPPKGSLILQNEGGFAASRVELRLKPARGQALPADITGWSGTGVAKVRMPSGYRVVSFTAADVGTTREGLTLRAWGRGRVELEDAQARLWKEGVRNSLEHPESAELVGLTAEGRRLMARQPVTLKPVEDAFFDTLTQRSWEELPAALTKPKDIGLQVVHQVFEGELARLDVYVPEQVTEYPLPIQLRPLSPGAVPARALPVAAPPRTLCDVSVELLEKEVRIFGSRLDSSRPGSEFSSRVHGRPSVAALLPLCDNTWFSHATLDGLKFLDASGRPVAAEPLFKQRHPRAYSFGHEFFFRKPGQEPEPKDATYRELARIEGVARITVPRLRVISLTRSRPRAEGVELLPEKDAVRLKVPVSLHARLVRGEKGLVDRLRDVTAYDAKGRLLRDVRPDTPLSTGDTVEDVRRFLGRWERIDLLLIEEQVGVERPFAVTLPAGSH